LEKVDYQTLPSHLVGRRVVLANSANLNQPPKEIQMLAERIKPYFVTTSHPVLFVFAASLCLTPTVCSQTIWNGGAGDWTDDSNWSNGVPAIGNPALIDDDNAITSEVAFNGGFSTSNKIQSLTIDADDVVRILNGQRMHFDGNGVLNNDGLIQHEGTGFTWIRALNNLTINGSGSIHLNGGSNAINGANNATLINGADHTIAGAGDIGSGTLFTNNGLVEANMAGQSLRINTSDTNFVNTGIVRATGGGVVSMATTGNQQGGIFEATGPGSRIDFFGGTIQNAALFGSSGGVIRQASAAVTLQDVTNLGFTQVQTAHVLGNLQNSGTLQFLNSANDNLVLDSNVTLSGGGTTHFLQGGPNVSGNHELTILDQTLSGKGTFLCASMILDAGTILSPSNGSNTSIGIFDFDNDASVMSANHVQFQIQLAGPLVNGAAPSVSLVNTGTNPDSSQIEYDQCNVFSEFHMQDGLIQVSLVDGFVPQPGDFFDILTADTLVVTGNPTFDFPKLNGLTFTGDLLSLFDATTGTHRDVFRITFGIPAQSTNVAPDSFEVTRGTFVSGGVAELANSDDSDLWLRRSTTDTQSRIEFEVSAVSPVANPSSLAVVLEGSVLARSPVIQTIELFDFNTGSWELVDSREASRMTDSTVEVEVADNTSRFVEVDTLQMKARIHFQSTTPRQRFASYTDQFAWTLGL
jgi:hypothetical protein